MKNLFVKRALAIILTVVMMLGIFTVNTFAEENPISDARESVVKIVRKLVYTIDGTKIPAHLYHVGSGAFIATDKDPSLDSSDTVLTAYHVVDEIFYVSDWFVEGTVAYDVFKDYNGLSVYDISMFSFEQYILLENDVKISFTVDKSAKSAESDWAILHLDKPLNVPALVLGKSSELTANDDVWALGFPDTLETSTQTYTKNDVIVTKGIVSKTEHKLDAFNATFIMHTAATKGGNSGGPLVDENGHIVGIIVKTSIVTDGLGNYVEGEYKYAAPIDQVTNICEKLGTGLVTVDDLVPEDTTTEEPPVKDPGDGIPAWVFVVIAIAVLAVIAVVVIVVSKNKQSAPVAAANPAASANVPHLVVQTGRLAGRRYRIDGIVKIGRDGSQCNIVYPADTAGISGTHCEVFMQGGVVYLRDLKSSYGTFLSSGMKLQPGSAVVLTVGSSFYLASPENTFVIQY